MAAPGILTDRWSTPRPSPAAHSKLPLLLSPPQVGNVVRPEKPGDFSIPDEGLPVTAAKVFPMRRSSQEQGSSAPSTDQPMARRLTHHPKLWAKPAARSAAGQITRRGYESVFREPSPLE